MKTIALGLLLIGSGLAALAIEPASSPANYIPCKIHQNRQANYPIRLLHQGVLSGEATAVIEVDSTGHVTDRLVTSYTRREFADQMMYAIDHWTFEPGQIDGKPVISVFAITFEYTFNGVAVYEKRLETNEPDSWWRSKYEYYAHGAATLDRKPLAVSVAPPFFPQTWLAEGHTGSVTVRFFIDESGKARLPMIIDHGDTLLASAAAAAVRQWRFEPPTHRGKPVLAVAEQVFVFARPAAPDSKS